jgi:ligand-binding sensor domain-containing protein
MTCRVFLLVVALAGLAFAESGTPYVYKNWRQFTVEDGLPNDHIFSVKSQGDHVWVGTENGLARIDKRNGKIESWTEAEGLPWRVVTGIDVDPRTGDVWLALFGGGLARYSAGRFDHWHQMNSGIVNDVAYGVAVQDEFVWVATTAGASRYNTVTKEWQIFTEKNAPMEEIWNYGANYRDGKVHLAVWGGGVLEYDVATGRWKDYLDPDGEMEIDLYRDDGIVHVITTAANYIEKTLWVSTYFGVCRYDGRKWRGYYNMDSGLASDFVNNLSGRSAKEAWFATDKGASAIVDAATNTWVTYSRDANSATGRAVVTRDKTVIETVEMGLNLPNNYVLAVDIDGDDVFVATAHGLAWGVGDGYYPGLRAEGAARQDVRRNKP